MRLRLGLWLVQMSSLITSVIYDECEGLVTDVPLWLPS